MPSIITDFFEQDHQKLDKLFTQFQNSKHDQRLAIELFSQFKLGLLQHIEWEEELLFPMLEKASGLSSNAGPTAVMRIEHRQIKDYLTLIEQWLVQTNSTEELEIQLIDLLSSHNTKEERVLYPMSDHHINSDMAQHIINCCRQQQL